ncbi:MAG: glycosyltransferase family 4 protein [Acidobacteriota bacterium]
MKVARIITRLNIGGPSIQAITLTSRLAARGHTTMLLHGRLGPGEGDMRYLAGPDDRLVFVAPLRRAIAPVDDLRALITLYRELRRFRPAVIHTHMAKAGLLGRLAARAYNLTRGNAPRARVVHTYHGHVLEGYFGGMRTAIFIALERGLARLSDAIVAISPAVRGELLDQYRIGRREQYRVIPLGFDLSPFATLDLEARTHARQALQIAGDAPVVTTVGRLTAIKQHHLFLEVAGQLIARHPDAVILLVGDGELRTDLEAHASRLGLGSQVRFLGWRRDLATIYAATDVFALTSRNEGTPVALIEAMASGVPGVSTDVGGVRDVIQDGTMGIRVPLDDTAGFADNVLRLLTEPLLRAEMGARGRRHVLDHFDIERLTSDVARLYHELIGGA